MANSANNNNTAGAFLTLSFSLTRKRKIFEDFHGNISFLNLEDEQYTWKRISLIRGNDGVETSNRESSVSRNKIKIKIYLYVSCK